SLIVPTFELAFAPLALVRAFRPWLWTAMLVMQLALIALLDSADLRFGMLMLQFFTFDPAWIAPRREASARIFYDGHCGLCHGFLRFVLGEDRPGTFRFAPIESATFEAEVSEAARSDFPDSVAVRTSAGALLSRSTAVLYVLARLGGLWTLLSW